jgi:hypothetical protein
MPQPKKLFLESKDRCRVHSDIVNSDAFEESLVFALAEVSAINPSAEQMRGINYFIDVFTHLSEKDEEREDTFAAPRLIAPEQLVPTKK